MAFSSSGSKSFPGGKFFDNLKWVGRQTGESLEARKDLAGGEVVLFTKTIAASVASASPTTQRQAKPTQGFTSYPEALTARIGGCELSFKFNNKGEATSAMATMPGVPAKTVLKGPAGDPDKVFSGWVSGMNHLKMWDQASIASTFKSAADAIGAELGKPLAHARLGNFSSLGPTFASIPVLEVAN